jgi:predicted transcriptional regulator
MNEPADHPPLAELTEEIVSAYFSHNQVRPGDVADLIGAVASRLATLNAEEEQAAPAKPEPAESVRRSVGKDNITCLACGKKQKLLKRHLSAAHSLTPAQYRELYGLKRDYPMVAPSYAESRSELARRIGLGRPKKGRAPTRRAKAAAKAAATK